MGEGTQPKDDHSAAAGEPTTEAVSVVPMVRVALVQLARLLPNQSTLIPAQVIGDPVLKKKAFLLERELRVE